MIPAGTRRTIDVNSACGCEDDVSTLVVAESGQVAVESTIQRQGSEGLVIADSIGAQGPDLAGVSATRWLSPEGATHSGFATFILIANPDPAADAAVKVMFLIPGGPSPRRGWPTFRFPGDRE